MMLVAVELLIARGADMSLGWLRAGVSLNVANKILDQLHICRQHRDMVEDGEIFAMHIAVLTLKPALLPALLGAGRFRQPPKAHPVSFVRAAY